MCQLLLYGKDYWRFDVTNFGSNKSALILEIHYKPNGELLVAVDHNQLRTMAPDTVYQIDWSHPPPSWAVPPWGPRV